MLPFYIIKLCSRSKLTFFFIFSSINFVLALPIFSLCQISHSSQQIQLNFISLHRIIHTRHFLQCSHFSYSSNLLYFQLDIIFFPLFTRFYNLFFQLKLPRLTFEIEKPLKLCSIHIFISQLLYFHTN